MKNFALWRTYKDNIKTKLIINIILIHAILMGLVIFDLLERERSFMEKELSQKGYDLTSVLSKGVTVPLLNNDLVAVKELLSDTEDLSDVYMMFALDKHLKVKAATHKEYFAKTLYDDTSKNLLNDLKKSGKKSFQIIHHNLIDTIHVVEVDGRTIGYIRTILNRNDLLNELAVITNKGIIYILFAILFGAFFAWLAIRTMTKNLRKVSLAAENIANNNFNIKLEVPKENDEIAKMMKAFIIMRNSIRTHLNELEKSNKIAHHEKKLAEITLSSIGDCVIVTNKDGYVKFINPSAQKIIKYSNQEAKNLKIEELFEIRREGTNENLQLPIYKSIKENKIIWYNSSIILTNKDDEKFYIENSASPIQNVKGEIEGAILVFRDVTYTKKAQRESQWNATHDSLTNLSSRTAFDVVLENLLRRIKFDYSSHIFLFMDLDKFKTINDSVGHLIGDQVLKDIAKLFQNNMRKKDFLFRFGGDEFGIILFDCEMYEATQIAQNLIDKVLEYALHIDKKTFKIGLSIGISEINLKNCDFTTILSSADFACYLAKDKGRNRYHIAHKDDKKMMDKEFGFDWIAKITDALREKRFILYIQKIKDLISTNDHYEILLRMQDKNDNIIYPDTFLPHAETYSLMPKIDKYVIETFFKWYKENQSKLSINQSFSINLAGQSISQKNFDKDIIKLVDKYNIETKNIIFEVTETTAIDNISESKKFFSNLTDIGFRFSLDDFGTGLSSFEYLKSMPIDFLKIDGIFIKDILEDKIDRSMVEAIYNIGSIMNLKIIAEYCENDEIIDELKKIGIHYAQGYAIEKPHDINDII